MNEKAALDAFKALLKVAKEEGVPHEIRLTARPVIDAEHPGDTVKVVENKQQPEGTIPTEPDALAFELHVGGPQGAPLGGRMLEVAAEKGLKVGTSDVLLL